MKQKYIITIFFLFLVITTSAKGKIIPSLYNNVDQSKMNHWVDSVFNRLTPDERIGQLFIVVAAGNNTTANTTRIQNQVRDLHLGGILFSKGNPIDQAELTNAAQSVAKVPLMITLDGEWGLSMRLSNTTVFPRNMMLGALQNDSLLYYYGLEVARQCKLMGIHVNFAPDIDVNSNPSNPVIGNRSYGEDPLRVGKLGTMYSKGLEAGGIMAVSKHFPGHGDTSTDSHYTLPVIDHDKDRFYEYELIPFREYINAGLSGVMIAHLNIPALDSQKQPSSLSKKIVTDLLQDELGFSGLIFTDGLQMKGVSNEDNHCVRALLAGNDILLGPTYIQKEYEAVKKAVANKTLSESLIDAKCKKILAYKYILNVNNTKPIETSGLIEKLNTPNSEWLNRKLNAEAITVLKNNNEVLPLKDLKTRKIAAISIGASSNNTFHSTLKQYGKVDCFNVANADALAPLKKQLDSYNTLIISIHTTKVNANAAIRSISQGKTTILSFFTTPYRMTSYASGIQDADVVIAAYEGTKLAQDYAAQAIFGGINVNAKIPVSVGNIFKVGDGITIEKNRLGYGVPEEVGIESNKFDSIASIVQEGIQAEAFPGCQILIAKNGIVIYDKSFGSFEYDGKRPVTNDDIYDIASMTKASATLPAIMKLYDKKKISLNDPISNFVDALKGTDKADITIRDALLHESRLPSFIPYYMDAIDGSSYAGRLFNREGTSLYLAEFDAGTWARTDYKYKSNLVSNTEKEGFAPLADNLFINKAYNDTIISAIAKSRLSKRKSYVYSCLNFMLLKEIVEKQSNQDLNSFVQDNFFEQLGATTTTYNPLTKFEKEQIAPTEQDDFLRKQLLQGYVHDEGAAFMGGISGNAGLFSNANDLAKLYQMWLNNGVYGGERYLSKNTCTVFTNTRSGISRRGLGFDKPETRTNKSSPTSISTPANTYGHTGFTGTCFWVDPDNDLIFIFLSNRIFPKRTHKDLMSLGIRPRIQEEIYKAIKSSKVKNIGMYNN